MTTKENQPYTIHCSTVWGGIEPAGLDLSARSMNVSLCSTASGGKRGGDIYYMSVCSADVLTYLVVADVRGHGEQVSEISSWIYRVCRTESTHSTARACCRTSIAWFIAGVPPRLPRPPWYVIA